MNGFARSFLALFATMVLFINAYAQDESGAERFSHKGVKFALGSASFEMTSERDLNEGEGGMLSLGYGFTERFSLWLTLLGSEHVGPRYSSRFNSGLTEFSGIELNVQHKFEIESRWQPYGKIGVGVYGLDEHGSDVTLLGAGINLGLGLDFFFAKHFGVGAEIMWKKLDYVGESRDTAEGTVITDITPHLNGDTTAFMLTFTIQ